MQARARAVLWLWTRPKNSGCGQRAARVSISSQASWKKMKPVGGPAMRWRVRRRASSPSSLPRVVEGMPPLPESGLLTSL